MHTCIVFPFLALTTSPGLFALPLGMFSQRGAKPQREKEKCITSFFLRKDVEKTLKKTPSTSLRKQYNSHLECMLKIQIFLVIVRHMIQFSIREISLHVAPPHSLTYTISPPGFTSTLCPKEQQIPSYVLHIRIVSHM